MPTNQFQIDAAPDQWIETPDDPASFGLLMFDGTELFGDHEQGIEVTREEFGQLKKFLAAVRTLPAEKRESLVGTLETQLAAAKIEAKRRKPARGENAAISSAAVNGGIH
jgi:hypothetical protein